MSSLLGGTDTGTKNQKGSKGQSLGGGGARASEGGSQSQTGINKDPMLHKKIGGMYAISDDTRTYISDILAKHKLRSPKLAELSKNTACTLRSK